VPEQVLKTEYVVVARASRPGPLPFVLKHGESFAVFDPLGDIHAEESGDLGVFHEGTRHVSRLELRLWNQRPLLLSSTVREDNCVLVSHLMNPDLGWPDVDGGLGALAKGTLHIQRSSVLTEAACLQQLAVTNYGDRTLAVPLSVVFDADFRDVFEVRGMTRVRRGTLRREVSERGLRLAYAGLDGRVRVSDLRLACEIGGGDGGAVRVDVTAPANRTVRVCLCIDFVPGGGEGEPGERFERAVSRSIERFRAARRSAARIHTSNEQFNQWLSRSFSDVHLLATETTAGLYPYAGVPWFSAPFGRDGIITARQMLTVEPGLARGVLLYLAERQATRVDAASDAEPGKILHEARLGEMAALGEIPFGSYYGSIDSTPLFLMLAGDYLRRTDDAAFIRTIWPAIESALWWLERHGDPDGDGFLEYRRRTEAGLRNQGWKDSEDSISHGDGSLAEGAIALCEVQAYAYGALQAASFLHTAMGMPEEAGACAARAADLRSRFLREFWRDGLGSYALALDGEKRPCDVVASNAGHALWSGVATREHAASIARRLMTPTSFSGWGVRTLDEGEARYNPMSYHNGSVWPHDNSIVALGLARYGFTAEALRIMTGLFEASISMPMHRLPELFCGFARREDEGPTLYPVACVPQAWASGAVFALLEAAMGLSLFVNHESGRPTVRFSNPVLPPYLRHVHIADLRVGDEELDVELHRYEQDVGVSTMRRSPRVEVIVTK